MPRRPEPIDSPHRGTTVTLDGCGAEVTILDGPDPHNTWTYRYPDGSIDIDDYLAFRDPPF